MLSAMCLLAPTAARTSPSRATVGPRSAPERPPSRHRPAQHQQGDDRCVGTDDHRPRIDPHREHDRHPGERDLGRGLDDHPLLESKCALHRCLWNLGHRYSSISPRGRRRDLPARALWKSSPINGEAISPRPQQQARPERHHQDRVGGILDVLTVMRAPARGCPARTPAGSPSAPTRRVDTHSAGPSSRPSTIVWTTTTSWQTATPTAGIDPRLTTPLGPPAYRRSARPTSSDHQPMP